MRPRIAFGVFSATQRGDAVDQLAEALRPHTVVVHHDYRKRADFSVSAANVVMVPDPRNTGWGSWGFADSIFHTLDFARRHLTFDFFQMMSPTCLPIRPVEALEERIARNEHDIHADLFPIERDADTLMNYAFRTYAPGNSQRMRVLRRARHWYFDADSDWVQTTSQAMLVRPPGRPLSLRAQASLALTRLAARGWLATHPFGAGFRPMLGGIFIGMRPHVVDHLLAMRTDPRVTTWFPKLNLVDELLFPTLLANTDFRIGPSNHAVSDFSRQGSPRWLDDAHLDDLVATGRIFARKFPDDPQAALRARALALARPPKPRFGPEARTASDSAYSDTSSMRLTRANRFPALARPHLRRA